MSTSLLYHGFSIRGYKYVRTEYQGGEVILSRDIRFDRLNATPALIASAQRYSRGWLLSW
jgi:hypothetical protein